jgi:catechol 2,3-dioxygenase-like lactoylglutathione lyase family enzyme/uncharacterized protein YndB with AHSA1/START domain
MLNGQNVCQVAFSTLNAKRLRRWYIDVFELVSGGGTVFGGPPTDRIQGMHNVWERCLWAIDSQDYFQFEFFQFWNPKSKRRPQIWKPTDIGYSAAGIVVRDFDATLKRAANLGSSPVSKPAGEIGSRRVALRDPDGNLIEVLEKDPLPGASQYTVRPEVPSTVRTMTVSVPDLERASKAWVEAFGLQPVDDIHLHTDADASLWGIEKMSSKRQTLTSGNFLVELVQYAEPVARPWPDGYQICDEGYMNIAVGFPDAAAFDRRFAEATGYGARPNGKPVDIGVFKVMYVNDSDGFSVEMLAARRQLWSLSGFNPGIPYVENEIWINAAPEKVWDAITDHASMGNWSAFSGSLLQPGEKDINGVGAMRQLKGLGLTIDEEVTDWLAPERYTYRLRKGAPVKNHRGDITLTPANNGTKVRWTIQFESTIPLGGKATAISLRTAFGSALKRLKAQLE